MQALDMASAAVEQGAWTDEERRNVELVADFVQRLMNDHDLEYVEQTYGAGSYTQHNRNMDDGIPGVVAYVRDLIKRFPEYAYDVKQVMADGDRVILHSHATVRSRDRGNDGKGFNIMDVWQIRDGRIVEHWDTLQPLDASMRLFVLLAGGRIQNANGVF